MHYCKIYWVAIFYQYFKYDKLHDKKPMNYTLFTCVSTLKPHVRSIAFKQFSSLFSQRTSDVAHQLQNCQIFTSILPVYIFSWQKNNML